MVIVRTMRGPFQVMEVFYPRIDEIPVLVNNLSFNQIVYLRQMSVNLPRVQLAASYIPFETSLLDLNRDERNLLACMSRTCRYQIRKADDLACRVEVRENDSTACRDFLSLHNQFVTLKRHAERLSEGRLQAYRRAGDVLVAYFDGQPVCGHLVLRDERVRRVGVLFTASRRLLAGERTTFISALNRWLHWYEMRQYKSQGMNVYDFGGLGTDTAEKTSIAFFKQSFGGTPVLEHSYLLARLTARIAVRLFYMSRRIRSRNPLTGILNNNSVRSLAYL